MRLNQHITAALGVSGLLPGQSIATYLPVMQLNASRTKSTFANTLAKRSLNRFCTEDPDFFQPTPENWRDSRAGERYTAFVKEQMRFDPLWGKQSEASLFARKALKQLDFECGISYKGCKPTPDCNHVLTLQGDKDKARWIYFILRSMHFSTLISAVIDEQTVRTEVDLSLQAESAAHTFLWKFDESVENKCKIYTDIAKAAILGAFVLLAAAVPYAAPAVAGVFTAAAVSPYTVVAGETAVRFASSFPTEVGGDAIKESVCKNFANAPKELEGAARRQIKTEIVDFYNSYSSLVQSTNSKMIRGSSYQD
ncbi:MAG: hypothetical protein Q9220_001162 [cf. Caloplaca sp. 1 TL-2023]